MITLLNKFDDNYIIREKDILDVVKSYTRENNIGDYLSGISFSNTSNHLGYYDINSNQMILNSKKIIKLAYSFFEKLKEKYSINENYATYFINYFYLYILYHDLTHIKQRINYENNLDNLYSYLYKLCLDLHQNEFVYYNQNHGSFSMEIEANNVSLLKAYNIMSCTKLPKNECQIMRLEYLLSVLSNYEKINNYYIMTPLEKLNKEDSKINLDKIYELLDKAKLSKIERFNLGLNITPREYDSIENEKNKLLTKIKK